MGTVLRPPNVLLAVSILLMAFAAWDAGRAAPAPPQPWGTVKGRVLWGAGDAPEREALPVNKDRDACLQKGPILSEKLVIDRKSLAVRDVFVWLMVDSREPKDVLKPPPIHPDLKTAKETSVTLTVSCCRFEPHAFALREGQSIRVTVPGPIAHNVKIDGSPDGENQGVNLLVPPGGKAEVGPLKAQRMPLPVSDSIHSWMGAWCRVFNHPYYCVTGEDGKFEIKDAPAGRFRLVVWHPEIGWCVGEKQPDRFGVPVEIKAGGTIDLGDLKVKPRD
jgi:hypothetical protein